jgi:hypothetical protein
MIFAPSTGGFFGSSPAAVTFTTRSASATPNSRVDHSTTLIFGTGNAVLNSCSKCPASSSARKRFRFAIISSGHFSSSACAAMARLAPPAPKSKMRRSFAPRPNASCNARLHPIPSVLWPTSWPFSFTTVFTARSRRADSSSRSQSSTIFTLFGIVQFQPPNGTFRSDSTARASVSSSTSTRK